MPLGSTTTGDDKQRFPGRIKVEPALGAEPTRRHRGHVKQRMPARANQLRSVPRQKGSSRQTHPGRMRHSPQANRTTIPLIEENPAQPEEAHRERRNQLDVLRANRVGWRVPVGQIERRKVDRRQQQSNLGAQEHPAEDSIRPRGSVGAKLAFAQGNRGDCW